MRNRLKLHEYYTKEMRNCFVLNNNGSITLNHALETIS